MKTLLLILTLALAITAQQPDQWRGLVVDQSTPDEALKLFGTPKSDQVGDRFFLYNGKWFVKDVYKRLRTIHYETIEGFKDVKLMFDDSRLAIIQLEPKKDLTAQAFIASYEGVDFRFANEVMSPSDFKTARNTEDKPTRLEASYGLVTVTDKVVVYGFIDNAFGSVSSGLFGSAASRQSGRSTPGKLRILQLISRKLETKGSDLLK